MPSEQVEVCPSCRGTGWAIETRGELEVAVRCGCRREQQIDALLAATQIPRRFRGCTLEGFELWDPSNPTLGQARRLTREFIDTYTGTDRQKGLLYMGPAGIGKTHLAVAALKQLVLTRGVLGRYVNFVDLVQELQMSFDGGGRGREEILAPAIEAEVVVLDDLGAGKLTQWVMDLVYFVVNSRYMDNRATLVTTNFSDYERQAGVESLADRVSMPVRSRLYEMCELVDLRAGELGDYRRAVIAKKGRRT